MKPSEFYPGYSDADTNELHPGDEVLVSYGIVRVDRILKPNAEGRPGFVTRGVELRQHASNPWLVRTK